MSSDDLGQKINSLVREGEITQIYPERMTARVTFGDKDDIVSAELGILTQGSAKNKKYFNYDIGDQVVCLFAPNDETSGTGWIIGSAFNEVDKVPEKVDADVQKTEFADGTFISYNRKTHEMEINCKGVLRVNCQDNIYIMGANVFINEGD